jgi:hypothetical protein
VVDGKATFIQDVFHNWIDTNNPDTSAAIYPINFQSLQKNPAAAVTKDTQRPPKLALAFYYPWFPGYAWSDTTPASDSPQIPIDDLDPAAITWQITQAKSAGIDGFIVSYNSDWSDDRMQVLLDAARAQNFYITLNLETMDNPNQKVWPPEAIKGWLVHAYGVFAGQPAFLKVDGRPVVVLYCSGSTPLDTWRDLLASLRNQGIDWMTVGMGYDLTNLSVFDGVHSYAVNDYVATLDQTYLETSIGVRNNALLDASASPKIWAATVQPGFDSTPYGSTPVIFERGTGEFYRSTFEAALNSSPDWIFITSWNEYGENTHIEPSQRDGALFLQITREYIAKFKNDNVK